MHKTTLRQNVQNTDRTWFVVDAEGQTLGRLSVAIANALRGRNRADFTPHVDGGDYVVVVNTEKIKLTGKKEDQKNYYRHSGYLGNLKSRSASEMRSRNPRKIIESSVYGMLPNTKLRDQQMKRLLLVIGNENPHMAQKPEPLPFV